MVDEWALFRKILAHKLDETPRIIRKRDRRAHILYSVVLLLVLSTKDPPTQFVDGLGLGL